MKTTRRTAIKAIAAAMMAPNIVLRQEIDREAILKQFCTTQESRYSLESPFGIGSLTYATDARFICRAEIANRIESGERRLPMMAPVLYLSNFSKSGYRLFELPAPEELTVVGDYGKCPHCGDRRISIGTEYPEFDKYGRADKWSGKSIRGLDYDPDDNTIRDPSCDACRGKEWKGPSRLIVCGVEMDYSQMKTIATIPNVEVAEVVGNANRKSMICFRGDGFEGLACGFLREPAP